MKNKNQLLDLVKKESFRKRGNFLEKTQLSEFEPVAIAWLKGEVSTPQISRALGYTSSAYSASTIINVANTLRKMVAEGRLKISEFKSFSFQTQINKSRRQIRKPETGRESGRKCFRSS